MRTRHLRRCRLSVEELEGRLVPAMLAFSTNWSGYAIVGGTGSVSAVSGAWTVPAVAQSYGYSATWVGIDGFNSRSVEQIGTESDNLNGQASYYAWYEMYPMPSVQIAQPIQPGDAITASVAYASGSGFMLTINDSSWAKPFTQTVQSAAPRTSAEWVVEAPSIGNKVQPLADFGTQTISSASATVHGTTGSITSAAGTAPVAQVDMASNRGTLKDTTSPLNAAGTGFTVTFDSSGPTRPGPIHGQAPSHDTNTSSTQVPTFIILIVPTGPAFTPLLINELPAPPQQPTLPPTSITAPAQPPIAATTLLDPFYGTPGVSDALPAGNVNAPGGVIPAGPAVPEGRQNGPVVPAGPQLRPDGIATPPASSMVLPEGNEGAAMVQDGDTASREPADTTERTIEVAGVVLTLALSGSCGVSIGERTARVKPGDAEPIPLRVR